MNSGVLCQNRILKQLKEMERESSGEMKIIFEQQEASHELQQKRQLEIQDQIGRFRREWKEFDRRDNWQKKWHQKLNSLQRDVRFG